MRSHSVTCHPAEVTFPPLPQPILSLAILSQFWAYQDKKYSKHAHTLSLCWLLFKVVKILHCLFWLCFWAFSLLLLIPRHHACASPPCGQKTWQWLLCTSWKSLLFSTVLQASVSRTVNNSRHAQNVIGRARWRWIIGYYVIDLHFFGEYHCLLYWQKGMSHTWVNAWATTGQPRCRYGLVSFSSSVDACYDGGNGGKSCSYYAAPWFCYYRGGHRCHRESDAGAMSAHAAWIEGPGTKF